MNETYTVELYLYDISNGMARNYSKFLLGKQIDAIYHTGLVVYGVEYYFGGGICQGFPGVSYLYHNIPFNIYLFLNINIYCY
jgi:hypothetical protein